MAISAVDVVALSARPTMLGNFVEGAVGNGARRASTVTMVNDESASTLSQSAEKLPLRSAFELFVEASNSLERQYAELAQKAELLSSDLVRANQRLSTLLNALPAAVILIEDTTVSHFNKAAQLLIPDLEYGKALALPRSWSQGTNAEEYVIPSETTEKMVQLISVSEGTRSVVQIQDITENVRSREEKERVDRLAAMGHMSAGIAHQFRTPLATAMLYSGHLTSRDIATEDKQEFAKKLNTQLQRLGKLSEDMLKFVKNKSHEFTQISLQNIIDAASLEIEALLSHSHSNLIIEGSAETFSIKADRESLVSAFVAVLENAIEYSPANSVVTLSIEIGDQSSIVTITDQGSGISHEVLARLFEPFASGRSNGTGLGLATAKTTINAHGGDITGVNRPSGGAQFRIRLPGFKTL